MSNEKLIQIQKDLQASKPKVKPYVYSKELQKKRQNKLNHAYYEQWFDSIAGEYNTSENYFKGEYNKWKW